MKEYKNSNLFQNNHGPGGGSGSGSQGPDYGGGGSNTGFQGNQGNHDNQGGFHQQSSHGNQGNQQQHQSGYQNNPKQLNSGQYHVFTTSLCKRDQKLHKRVVNAVETAIPRYLQWSEQPIVWSREDHPPRVDNPGHLALVVAPQVGGYKFTKVLMDGGSSINILYYETFRRMGLTDKNIKPSYTVFHGVVLMTHKYRGSIVVLSISKSVEPNEEQKEMISCFQQGILCKH